MAILHLDSGAGHTYGTQSLGTVTGNVSIISDTTLGSAKAVQVDATGTGTNNYLVPGMGTTPGRVQFYWMRTTAPSGSAATTGMWTGDPGQIQMERDTGIVKLGAATSGSGFTPELNRWYRLTKLVKPNGGNWDAKFLVDGVEVNERVNFSAGASSSYRWGSGSSVTDYGVFRIKHMYADDNQAYTDPGPIWIADKLPSGVTGTTNAFDTLIGSTTNRWDYVNERAISESLGVSQTGISIGGNLETYNIQAANVGDVNITGKTLLARGAWVWAKRSAGSPSSGERAKIVLDSNETYIDLGTSSGYYTVFDATTTYPGANACGLRSLIGTIDTFLYECGVMLAYRPGAGNLLDGLLVSSTLRGLAR